MSYCVHCGVKLGEGEKRCPLCKTAVYDPAEPAPAFQPRAYPVRTPEQEIKKSKRFLLSIFGILLLAPALLCLVIDLLTNGGVTWSGYASSALVLLFISIAVPLLAEKRQVYYAVGCAFICLNVYLFLVENFSLSGRWFFPIALPALSLAAVLLSGIIVLYRIGKLNKVTLISVLLLACALESVFVEWLVRLSQGNASHFTWSPFVLAPCLFLSLSLFFINGNRAVREEVRRRVHF